MREPGLSVAFRQPDGYTTTTMRLAILSAFVLLINLPFGYWRSRVRRFSLQWFLSVHLPVPLVIAVRVFGGLGFELKTYPALVGAYFVGQLLGSRLTRLLARNNA
ncbi:MAG: hypothetical protein ABSD38_32855 [Syntrophorhabdales bacterium]